MQHTERTAGEKPRKRSCRCQHKRTDKGKPCPGDWVQKQGKCYKFYIFRFRQKKSEVFFAVDTQLLSSGSPQDFIQNKMHEGVCFWIGLHITDPQKTWTWLDSTPLHPQLCLLFVYDLGKCKTSIDHPLLVALGNFKWSDDCRMEDAYYYVKVHKICLREPQDPKIIRGPI